MGNRILVKKGRYICLGSNLYLNKKEAVYDFSTVRYWDV